MDSYTFDLQRIFFGDLPLVYLLEIIFRTFILFGFTLLALRFVGHRGLGQLSMAEFVLIVALGSAVGDPMFYPDVPLVHGMIVIGMVVGLQRFLSRITLQSRGLALAVEGTAQRLVMDGSIDLEGIERMRISAPEVFAELRQAGIENLGQVRRAYVEIDGQFSVFRLPDDLIRAGLPLLPVPAEGGPRFKTPDCPPRPGLYACCYCGHTLGLVDNTPLPRCPRCKREEWMEAATYVPPARRS